MKTAKRPSIRDVAREAGVSHTTVSMILNGKQVGSAETRERVLEVSKRLDYQPDRLYRKAVTERVKRGRGESPSTATRILGLVISRFYYDFTRQHDGYYSGVFAGLCRAAEEAGWSILISPQPEQPDGLPEIVQDSRVDGVLVEGVFPLEWLTLLSRRIPTAHINSYHPTLDAISVTPNWERVGFKLVEYAWQMGHRKMAFFQHHVPSENLSRVNRGLHAALEHYSDANFHQGLSRPWPVPQKDDQAIFSSFVEEWLQASPRPTVIITTDYYASQLVLAFHRRGIRVPDDVSLIGRGGKAIWPENVIPLTTYAYPVQEIGHAAARLLIHALQSKTFHPSHLMIDGEFLIQDSVKKLTSTSPPTPSAL